MHWEEKIDIIKRETDPKDFKVPFTSWPSIFKMMEEKFIIKENSTYTFSNWSARLKDKQEIYRFNIAELEHKISMLNESQNYWIILSGDDATATNIVYDAKPYVIMRLLRLRMKDFYIVDKKYDWLAYFSLDNHQGVTAYKSGQAVTPWETK